MQNPLISNKDAANTMAQQGGKIKHTRKFRLTNKKNKTRTK